MSELSGKTALVVDHGLGLPIAHRLSDSFQRVLYHSPFEDGFARIGKCVIGDGFENVLRCDDPWSVRDEVDLWCFPDVYHAGWQVELASQDRAVWGSRHGDSLEINREKLMRVLGNVGLNVPAFHVVLGISNLREHLKDKQNKFIKISRFRGSFETAHWIGWEESNGDLDVWAVEFGACKELVRFLVFDPIGDELEIGCDTYNVDGEWPSLMLRGDEYKDKSYISAVTKRDDMPDPIKEVLEQFGPALAPFNYRNQFSMELRGEGDKWFMTDATCRLGLPSTASQLNLWKNFPEIVWAGAHGELIEPEPAAMFSVEVALTMKGEKGAWRKTIVPEKLRDVMKLGCCCHIDGAVCFPPDDCHEEEIGWLQAQADSIEDAVMLLREYASQLPEGVSAKSESLVDVLKEIHEAGEQGVPLTDEPVPEPEIAIADA